MMWYTSPFWFPTCNTITTPLVYSEDLSIAQQIAHLFGLFKEYREDLNKYVSHDDFKSFLEWLANEQEAQTEILEQYTDSSIAEVIELINELVLGQLQWNVQHGKYTTTVDAQRDMFRDVTIYSATLEELSTLDAYTVEAISELTCHDLATKSGLKFFGADYINKGIKESE